MKSLFAEHSAPLDVNITNEAFLNTLNQPWYTKYFNWAEPQIGLSFSAVLGEARLNAIASVVANDAETPLRAQEALAKLNGEVASIKHMYTRNASQMRDYLTLSQMRNVTNQRLFEVATQAIWNDAKKAIDGVHGRIDQMVLQILSTGNLTLNLDNNPDGLVLDVPMGLPNTNKKSTTVEWATSATATPIQDIQKVVNNAVAPIETILMSRELFVVFMKTKEVRDTIGAFYGLTKTASASETAPLTLGRVNEYLSESMLPTIEVIDRKVAVEKNGVKSNVNPFDVDAVTFIPSGGVIGEIKNAYADEELSPLAGKEYAKTSNVLVTKWGETEPFREFTRAETKAMPVVNAIESVYILDTSVTA